MPLPPAGEKLRPAGLNPWRLPRCTGHSRIASASVARHYVV